MNILVDILLVFQVLLLLAFALLLSYIGYIMLSFKNMVPYVPTPTRIVKKMIALANIQKGDKVCDLGSGSGKIIIQAAKKHKKIMAIGIEKSRILRTASKLRILLRPGLRKRIQFLRKDFFNVDVSNFDVVFCFLTPAALRVLQPKMQTLKKGSRIVCYMFHFEQMENFSEQIEHVTAKDAIYVYTKL